MLKFTRHSFSSLIHFFVAFLIIITCQTENKQRMPIDPGREDKIPKEVICPLVVGNYWAYVDSLIDITGFRVDTSRLVITGKTIIHFEGNPLDVFFWNWIDKKTRSPEDWKWLNRNEKEGLWTYGILSSKDTLLVKTLDIMYPIQVGQSWKAVLVYNYFAVSDTIIVTCIGKEEPFYTPAGEFKCYVYHYKVPLYLNKFSNHFGLFPESYFALSKIKATQLDGHELFLYLVPNLGYVGFIETIHGVPVWKKALLDYFVQQG